MPSQNRVTPLGELIADPGRGLVYGNRGCLHDEAGRIRRRHNGKRWIACRLRFRGWRRRPLRQPGRFTELFFLDEATAFAAGHRPCALCRREDYLRFGAIWREHHPDGAGADAIDEHLHAERLDPETRGQRRQRALLDELPDGVFVLQDDAPWMVVGTTLLRWTPGGYTERRRRQVGEEALLLTPPSLVTVLRAGWEPVVPLFHPSALAARAGIIVEAHESGGAVTGVIEIRTYRLTPGFGAAFHRAVVEESLPMLERWGVEVIASGPSLEDPDRYCLIRAYPSPAERQRSQDAFYGSEEWRHGPRERIVPLIESSISVVIPADSVLPDRG